MNDRNEQPKPERLGLELCIAVAIGENYAIGKNNQLLWHMPADLKFFKQTTSGHTVIMGRKTFDSVGKPLPNRRNIVITRAQNLSIAGAEVANSLQEAIDLCRPEAKPVFIIGGAEIYKQALPITQKLYLTTIHQQFEADTFFPEINRQDWKIKQIENHPADEKNPYPYTFEVLERK